ncbi:MAG: exonuclease domain-containing protein [Bacteroidales bacterium]|nr:exonuclease domain-containing protein [Bacteroidales bacterium]MDD3860824.1 exonuclease domain-containing protein [Bacteroidales bacterium]
MELNLKKPIVFFDLETTGINPATDRIVEISILKVFPNGKELSKTYRVNPEMEIPSSATEIHGITNDDVKDSPVFKMIAKELVSLLEDADIGGYNSNKFDVPLLAEEFLRVDVNFDLKKRNFIDIMVIFMKKEPRNLEAAYKFYCDKELKDAHSALADTRATYEVFKAQLEKYHDLGESIDKISEFSSHNRNADFAGRLIYDDNNNIVINFGKYKGQLLIDVLKKDPSYYDWVQKGDFPLYTKRVFTEVYLKSK